jgi:hypothetical protein
MHRLTLILLVAGVLCSGCITRTTKASYPEGWSPVTAVEAAACPRLAGRYVNSGEVAPGATQFSCGTHGPYRGEWCNQTDLSQNIGGLASADWVELRQPDADTLVIVSSDPAVPVRELHQRKGDYSCSRAGLERDIHASEMSRGSNAGEPSVALDTLNTTSTAYGLLMASGGVRTLTRRFNVGADGSLVMAVSQSDHGAMFLIPYHLRDETFVRWTRVTPPSGAVEPAGALPVEQVGIFQPTNGTMWSKVKVTNLDGTPVNTYAGLPGVPVALQPGRHWVQVATQSTHLVPPRDIDTKYAFEMDAVAGHQYRIPSKPSSCLASGNIDAALEAASVYHTRLSVIDKAPGMPERSFEVQALCISAPTYVCVPPPGNPGAEATDAHRCVTLDGWGRGYYGTDAGQVPAQ